MRFLLLSIPALALLAACGPVTFTMDVEMRGPSKSGLSLSDKNISVICLDNGNRSDSLYTAAISEGFAQSIENEYFASQESVGIFRTPKTPGADYAAKDSLVALLMETEADVAFVMDWEKATSRLRLYAYDSMNPKDSVYRYVMDITDSATQASVEGGKKTGANMARFFSSTWKRQSLPVVYYDSMGGQAWIDAAEAAYEYRWKDAMEIWLEIASSTRNMEKKGCAEYNIALACYMLGNRELAIEWLDRSDKDYYISPSVTLRKYLK